jgi:hypothetical protein
MNSETLSSLDIFVKISLVSFVLLLLLFVFFIVGRVKGRGRVEEGKIVVFYIGPIYYFSTRIDKLMQ